MADVDSVKRMELCTKYGAEFLDADPGLTVGIALNVREGLLPVNGMRLMPEGTATGWFIWGGQVASDEDDFYQPLHASHVDEWSPLISKYLGLAPGWRFLVTPDYEDVWFDPELLKLPPLPDP
jgi:hypothetical protein